MSPYAQLIVQHFKNPVHKNRPEKLLASETIQNPVCGDEITLYATEEDGKTVVYFDGKGCMLSLASGSILMEFIQKTPLYEWKNLANLAENALRSDHSDFPETILALCDVRRFPSREKCALLAWRAFEKLNDKMAK